jgi:hypothetical protein
MAAESSSPSSAASNQTAALIAILVIAAVLILGGAGAVVYIMWWRKKHMQHANDDELAERPSSARRGGTPGVMIAVLTCVALVAAQAGVFESDYAYWSQVPSSISNALLNDTSNLDASLAHLTITANLLTTRIYVAMRAGSVIMPADVVLVAGSENDSDSGGVWVDVAVDCADASTIGASCFDGTCNSFDVAAKLQFG